MTQLIWDSSPWWTLLCLVVGLGYAALLYGKASRPWSKSVRYTLFGLRLVGVSLLCMLLLEPFLKQLNRQVVEPAYVIAVDNSQSMAALGTSADSLQRVVNQIKSRLQFKGQVEVIRLDKTDTPAFKHPTTDLGSLLSQIRDKYENRNLAGLVLLSDGLYNQGLNPEYLPLPFPIFSLGAGDTRVRRDLILKNLYYNQIAYQGNKFIIQAEILKQAYPQLTAKLQVFKEGKLLLEKPLRLPADQDLLTEEITLEAKQAGYQRYTIKVSGPDDEFTLLNNESSALIEVIEGRQKILIAAASPHPDISALRQAIEQNQNYQTELLIPSLGQQPREQAYDAVIFHGLPAVQSGSIEQLMLLSRGHFFIWTPQTDIQRLNELQDIVRIRQQGQETDLVFPLLNNQFSRFSLPASAEQVLSTLPPTQVPYGEIGLSPKANVVLTQRIGRISTQKPLLALRTEAEQQTAVLLTEGLWRWRLLEAADQEGQSNAPVLDELIQKTLQLLATKDQEQRFKVYPLSDEVLSSEGVVFETELYNQLYERLYGQPINLSITNEAGLKREFTYRNNRAGANGSGSRYRVNELIAGQYTYRATTQLNAKTLSSQGSFQVTDRQLELLNLTANHDLLKRLSEKTGGNFYALSQLAEFLAQLEQVEARSSIIAQEEYLSALQLGWLLALLIALLSAEWFIRKFNGGY